MNKIKCNLLAVICMFMMLFVCITTSSVLAETEKNYIEGKIYVFDKDSDYETFENVEFKSSIDEKSYGEFSISGNVKNIAEKDDFPMYEISDGNIELFYNYNDELLKAEETNWHLIEDNSKKILNKKYDEKIRNGAILVQVSTDGKNWSDKNYISNAFSDVPVRTDAIYKSEDVELLNGCYYRVIVVYELEKKVEPSKILFITKNNFETKKVAEVYEFYASNSNAAKEENVEQKHQLGTVVKTKEFDGYNGEEEIDKKDPHYNWKLGDFYVRGYTDKLKNANGDMVFLKNVGDKVTLLFKLKQDINKLNNVDGLKITSDDEGYDQYFGTETMNFGRGTLIIRYTDYNNNTEKPQIYTNYLEANTSLNAETKVQLFEEGDYEIALDYEVTDDKLIDKVRHYRIYFKFSVRNGNCMVYPFDLATGNELTNSSMTENGFRLDLAKSRYLKVNVKKEILTEGADGLTEDTRFNGPAKDGAEYKDDGVYTITASNEYTNQITSKKIYVGTNNVLKAYMTSGLSIEEINNLVEEGAEIADDGSITINEESINDTNLNKTIEVINEEYLNSEKNNVVIIIIAIVIVVVIIVVVILVNNKNFKRIVKIVFSKKSKKKKVVEEKKANVIEQKGEENK